MKNVSLEVELYEALKLANKYLKISQTRAIYPDEASEFLDIVKNALHRAECELPLDGRSMN